MEMEELLEGMTPDTNNDVSDTDYKREKLIAAVIGGGKHIGSKVTTDKLNKMTDEEINNEYEKHNRRLGAVMVGTLGKSLIELYTWAVGMFLPLDEEGKDKLIDVTELRPFY